MTGMSTQEVFTLANEIRIELQMRACCPEHAAEVAAVLLTTFLMDSTNADGKAAAKLLEQTSKRIRKQLIAGKINLVKTN